MALVTRRNFLLAAGVGLLAAGAGRERAEAAPQPIAAQGLRTYSGVNLDGWETIIGDAIHPGQPAVQATDVETTHYPHYSEVRANVNNRPEIMAHNLTLRRYADAHARRYVHRARYAFRLPYLPKTTNRTLNGQTVEGALAVWDGYETQRLRSLGFQWIVNPYWMAGTIQIWTLLGWQPAGYMPVDMEWHTVQMVLDPVLETSTLRIDDVELPSMCVVEPKAEFGIDVAATLAAEAISLDPGTSFDGGMEHRVQFADWSWVWEPTHLRSVYLPIVTR